MAELVVDMGDLSAAIVEAYDDVNLPPEARALPEHQLRAWKALASGARFREAAAAAGVPVTTLWAWTKAVPALKTAKSAAYLPLADRHVDVLEQRLDDGLLPDADDKAKDRSLKAAAMVQRGLGIGAPAVSHASAHVAVTLHVSGALGQDSSSSMPTIDVTPDDQ